MGKLVETYTHGDSNYGRVQNSRTFLLFIVQFLSHSNRRVSILAHHTSPISRNISLGGKCDKANLRCRSEYGTNVSTLSSIVDFGAKILFSLPCSLKLC